ncbi:MAG: hypothetical protein GF347_05390 [Candidatus Moranbacteria bacterium]|nr:hypothetical protein [Candidatus Moranbacteria bacterium]
MKNQKQSNKWPVSIKIAIIGICAILLIKALTLNSRPQPQPQSKAEPKKNETHQTAQKNSKSSLAKQTNQATNTKNKEQESKEKTPPPKTLYEVVRVSDGDTISVNIDGTTEKIRMIGLDTPETVDPRKPVQCFGREASKEAKKMLEGQKVGLEPDPTQGEKDKYNRLLRYVYLEDGTLFNKYMIEEGFAHEYTYNLAYKYQKDFKQAEKEARENKKGLWGDKCNGDTSKAAINPPASPPQPTQTISKSASRNPQNYSCNCSKTCKQMIDCNEAMYQLNSCGCLKRDGDNDGIPCESICK